MKYKPPMESSSSLLVVNEIKFEMQQHFCLWNYLRLKMAIPDVHLKIDIIIYLVRVEIGWTFIAICISVEIFMHLFTYLNEKE